LWVRHEVTPHGRIDPSHAAAFVAVVVAHLALLALALTARRATTDGVQGLPLTILFFPAPRERERARARKPPQTRASEPISAAADEEPRPADAPAAAPITIDWAEQARRSAERQIAAADEAERLAFALAQRGRSGGIRLDTAPEPAPGFGWSHARIQRIERLESGAVILWINDRCYIVLTALAPICSLDLPEPNGALFEHMRDPPVLGDWKD
jgi:hypothetical protein